MMRPLEQFVAAVHKSVEPDATFESDLSPESAREAIHVLQAVVDACTLVQSRLHNTTPTPGITDGFPAKKAI
jgi:hypothetical protein